MKDILNPKLFAILAAILFVFLPASAHAQNKIDKTGDNFLGLEGGASGFMADKNQFMPVFYSMFEASPGVSASMTGTPTYSGGATQVVIGILRSLTVPSADGANVSKYVWSFFIILSIYGILHSGVHTYLRVAREGEPVGNATIAFLTKCGLVYVMITWVVAGAPRVMIRIVDSMSGLTEGQISAYTAQQSAGNLSDSQKQELQKEASKFYGMNNDSDPKKWAMNVMTPARLQFLEYWHNAKNAIERQTDEELGLSPGTLAAVSSSLDKTKSSYEGYWAHAAAFSAQGYATSFNLGPEGTWSLGEQFTNTVTRSANSGEASKDTVSSRAKELSTLLNLAYFPKVYNHVAAALGNTLQTPMHLSTTQKGLYASMPTTDNRWIYATFGWKPEPVVLDRGVTNTQVSPDNSAVLLNAFPETAIRWEEVKFPNKLIETALKGASMMLGIAIWGLPLSLLVWTGMYSLPKELNTGAVLTKTVNTALTIILTGILLGGSFVAGMAIRNEVDWTAADALTMKNVVARMIGGDQIEAILLVGFIIGSPGIAAKIVQGMNGLADGASKVLESSGKTSTLQTMIGMGQDIGGSSAGKTAISAGLGAALGPAGMAASSSSILRSLQGKR